MSNGLRFNRLLTTSSLVLMHLNNINKNGKNIKKSVEFIFMKSILNILENKPRSKPKKS